MGNAALVNFAAGETSPRSRGRFDLPWFTSACQKMLNFIAEIPGPARFRSGFKFVSETYARRKARLVPFQLNDSQAYMLEFTGTRVRVYKNGARKTTSRAIITGITRANPAIITVESMAGLANGDEITLTGIVGMGQLNGREGQLVSTGGLTFELRSFFDGISVDSTNFDAYISGGIVGKSDVLLSPYSEAQLDTFHFAQNRDTMYFAHPETAPLKLTVDIEEKFTFGTYLRTNDPFAPYPAISINGITLGTTTIVSFLAIVPRAGVLYQITGVVGTTQLNFNFFYLAAVTATTARLLTPAGVDLDSTTYDAWISGGTMTPDVDYPRTVAFYEGRLVHAGSRFRPNTIFGSRAPVSTTGEARYDDFTGGVNADDAFFFTLAPTSGRVDVIAWAVGTVKYLLVGTFGGPFRISGGGLEEPITPSDVNVKQIDGFGCETATPAVGSRAFFIQRGGKTLRTIRYSTDADDFESYDMCLNAEHIGDSNLRQVVIQTGRPDIVWVLRDDGILAGMTVQGAENVAGWHRQKIGGTGAKVISVAVLPRPDLNDQLWVVTERTINGITRRFVEIMADDVVFPDIEDFYSGSALTPNIDDIGDTEGPINLNQRDDLAAFQNAVYRRQEEYIHLDATGTYNGADRGVAAAAKLTPGALTGNGIAFTASAAVFRAGDVGNELWKKPDRETGLGAGRAVIKAFVSATVVTCDIVVDFDTPTAIAAGAWHIAVETIFVPHLDGATVAVVADGAVYSDGRGDAGYPLVTATNSKFVMPEPAAVVHVGLPYDGFLKTHNLEAGGRSGPAQSKPRNIVEIFARFLYTLGVDYGTDIYRLEKVQHRAGNGTMDRPSPVFSGVKKLPHADNWQAEEEKHVVIAQRLPLPCILQFLDLYYDTSDEG